MLTFKSLFTIFILNIFFSLNHNENYCIVKYIPFETHFNKRLSESDFVLLRQKKYLQVKNDTIFDKFVNEKIFGIIQLIKLQNIIKINPKRDDAEIRMMCTLNYNDEIINFFITKKMEIIFDDTQIINEDLTNLIFSQLCRPYYSFIFPNEEKYWLSNTFDCKDSLEFYKCYPK